MLFFPPELEELYDNRGRHFGGIFPPLLRDEQLTEAHARSIATRPVNCLISQAGVCEDPEASFGLLWMMPPGPDPLSRSVTALSYLVYALDIGASVMLHAYEQEAIDAVCRTLPPLLGGGHA